MSHDIGKGRPGSAAQRPWRMLHHAPRATMPPAVELRPVLEVASAFGVLSSMYLLATSPSKLLQTVIPTTKAVTAVGPCKRSNNVPQQSNTDASAIVLAGCSPALRSEASNRRCTSPLATSVLVAEHISMAFVNLRTLGHRSSDVRDRQTPKCQYNAAAAVRPPEVANKQTVANGNVRFCGYTNSSKAAASRPIASRSSADAVGILS